MRLLKFFAALTLSIAMYNTTFAQASDPTTTAIEKLIEEKSYNQALKTIDSALKTSPRNANLRFLKGIALTRQGNNKEALEIFTAMTQEFPELAHPYNNLAVLKMQAGNYAEARTALEAAIRINPNYTLALENLGDVYSALAQEKYTKAAQLNPKNTQLKQKITALTQVITPAPTPKALTTPEILKEVENTLLSWAESWSKRDVTSYISYYAPDFILPEKMTRKEWEADRKLKLENKKEINVTLQTISIDIDGDNATAHFTQLYHSDQINNTSQKIIRLKKIDNKWRIIQEQMGI